MYNIFFYQVSIYIFLIAKNSPNEENFTLIISFSLKKGVKSFCKLSLPRFTEIRPSSPIININAKNVKNDKILWEKHCLILGNV